MRLGPHSHITQATAKAPCVHLQWRTDSLVALTSDPLDVLVIGGGIVGAGIARDAAMRGLRTGLIEQYDFSWGTSSRSSRLLHGGIRYLAQGHVGLVRQASVEKCVVHRIAPHLTAALPCVFPTYRRTPWPRWKLRVGVKVYDLMCSGRNLGRSSALDVEQLKSHLPGVNVVGSTGAVRYFDGVTNDARLVLDTIRSAARHGAVVCSYARLHEAEPFGSRWQCRLLDTLEDREHRVRARCVVNATGPWADQFRRSRIKIRSTKGVHIVVDRSRLRIDEAVVMTEQDRVICAVPWGERVYVGTTDTDYDGRVEQVCTEAQDVQYLLDVLNRYFPEAVLDQGYILRTWAGLRPLVTDWRGAPSDVSRSHQIHLATDGWIDVAGGKLTTYRLMAQKTVDMIVRWLGCHAQRCCTATVPLLDSTEANGVSGIIPPPVSRAVVAHCCQYEWAVHLDDVMVRRTRWHYYHHDAHDIAQRVAQWMAGYLGWDAVAQAHEIARYQKVLD